MSERLNIKPSYWGPHAWFFIDNVAFSYPKKPTSYHKELFKNFFYMIGNIIPCYSCRVHFKKNLKKFPLTNKILSDREKFIEWVFNLHNLVRKSQGKELFTPSKIMEYYDNPKHSSNNDNTNYYLVFLVFILSGAIVYLVSKK